MDNRTTKRVTLTVSIPVMLTLDVAEGPNGVEVVSVRDVDHPDAAEVMEALDAENLFDELDKRYKEA